MSSKKMHVKPADTTPSPKKKQETNRFPEWMDPSKQSRRFFIDTSNVENPKITWIVLLGVSFFAILFGLFLIQWLPPEPRKPSRSIPSFSGDLNLTQNQFVSLRKFPIDHKSPSAWCSGKNNTFLIADTNTISLYDLNGKKIRDWKLDSITPNAVNDQGKTGDSKNGDLSSPAQKNKDFPLGKPTAICYTEYRNDQKSLTTHSLYFAVGNKIAVISSHEEIGARLLLDLNKNALITSIKIISHFLFLADYNNKTIYRYDLKNLDESIQMGRPDSDPENNFPGFKLSIVPHFDLAIDRSDRILYATNPVLFRVDAFNIDSGTWIKDRSWSKHPEQANGFTGCCNPLYLDVFSDGRILTAEKGKDSHLKIFDKQGNFLYHLNDPQKSIPLDGKKSLIPIIINDTTVVVLHPAGEAEVFVQNHEGK